MLRILNSLKCKINIKLFFLAAQPTGRGGGSAGWAKWPTFSKQKVGLGYFGMLRSVLGGVGGCKDHSKDKWECFPFNSR